MTKEELIALFDEQTDYISPAALIEFQDEKGLAIRIGENLADNWKSWEIIVFWQDGDHTVLPDEFELLKLDLWTLDE
jgi:hypothetical protein